MNFSDWDDDMLGIAISDRIRLIQNRKRMIEAWNLELDDAYSEQKRRKK